MRVLVGFALELPVARFGLGSLFLPLRLKTSVGCDCRLSAARIGL
jgi:hypothetical protein